MKAPNLGNKIIIQFDGICILCSRTVQLILKADRHKKFLFQTLQSTSGANEAGESILVKDGQNVYTHFEAVLKIGKELGGIYRLIGVFKILPRSWRHKLYLWVASHRYRWFGVRESCFFPSAGERERFI